MLISTLSGLAGGMLLGYFRHRPDGYWRVLRVASTVFFLIALVCEGTQPSGHGAWVLMAAMLVYGLFGGSLVVAGLWWQRKLDR